MAKAKNPPIDWSLPEYDWLTDRQKEKLQRLEKHGIAEREYLNLKRDYDEAQDSQEYRECLDEFVPFYNRQVLKLTKWRSFDLLQYQGKRSSKWIYVKRTWDFITENDLNWKVFVAAQFNAFGMWESSNKLSYPPITTFYSVRALKAYENYVYHESGKYKKEGWKSQITDEDKLEEEPTIIQEAVSRMAYQLKSHTRINFESESHKKGYYLYYDFNGYPEEYLATQHRIETTLSLDQFINDPPDFLVEKLARIQEILSDPDLLHSLKLEVFKEEAKLGVPKIPVYPETNQ